MLDPDRRHLIAYAAAAAVVVVVALQLLGNRGGRAPAPAVSMAAPPRAGGGSHAGAPVRRLWVDVAGAVRRPGLYSLPEGSRVAAAIVRAGGPRPRAELAAVNQAAKLADGQQIVVPMRGRGAAGVAGASRTAGASASGTYGTSASSGTPAASGASGTASAGSAPGLPGGARISLGSATPEQLEQLDGIGPALAARIVAYREAHGGFRSVDELQEVEGIGDKRFQALRASVQP
jgi:competence protein ComEA